MIFEEKMTNFVLKNDELNTNGQGLRKQPDGAAGKFCIKNDEFCIINDGFCIENDASFIKRRSCLVRFYVVFHTGPCDKSGF